MWDDSGYTIKVISAEQGGITLARPRKVKIHNPDNLSIGERLMQFRQARGLSQVDLAKKVGVHQCDISNCERGRYRPSTELLIKVSKVLGVSADELLGLRQAKELNKTPHTSRTLRRLQLASSLSRRDQQTLLRVLDGLRARQIGATKSL